MTMQRVQNTGFAERNPSQKKAIAHVAGPMMVLAGPGSGKTSVIVERIADLIQEREIPAASILVVTFSRAAAREMKERYLKRTDRSRTEVTFGTFHSIFYGILKAAYHLESGNILSEEEKLGILKELIQEYGGDLAEDADFPREIAKEIRLVKGNRIRLEHYYSSSCPDEVFRQICEGYRKVCEGRRKLDFDDMLVYCYELFVKRPDILAVWQKKFRYILVDEFQDINRIQYDTIRMLAKPENNLFIVGDDDQSIYHFRGSCPEIMLNFTKDYPGANTVFLDVNYRCSGQILTAAMRLIGHNETRYRKRLSTPNAKGSRVCCREFQTPSEEYRETVREIRSLLEKGDPPEETAVLLRSNQEAEGLVGVLMEYQVPFVMKEQLPDLFRHWISRQMLAYQRLAAGDRSRRTFLEVMNRPNRYISRDALASAEFSFEELKAYYREKDWMCDRITTLETHLRILRGLSPYAAMNFIRKGMGYEEYLKEYAAFRRLRFEELTEVLDRLMEHARGINSLQEWEQYIAEYSRKLSEQAKKQQERQPEGITVSTLHGVKGLEYNRVYILNVNEGSIPFRKAVLQASVEEERRLFYVGMTRAKKELMLYYVKRQYEKEREPSRFLEEAGVWTR